MSEKTLLEATFNPKVKTYFLINALLLSLVTVVTIPLLPIVIIVVLFIAERQLKAMSAKLLERKLVVKRGIWFVVEKSIPLEKITDVAMTQGPLMRMFNLYELSFETAGATAPGALVKLVGINQAADFREAILAQKDNLMSSTSSKLESKTGETNAVDNESIAINSQDIQALTASVQNIERMLAEIVAKRN